MRNRSSDGDSEAVRGLVVAGSDSVDMPGFGGPDAVGRAYRPVRVDTVGGTCDAGRMLAPHERRIPGAFVETACPDRIWTERAGARRRAPQTDRKDLLGVAGGGNVPAGNRRGRVLPKAEVRANARLRIEDRNSAAPQQKTAGRETGSFLSGSVCKRVALNISGADSEEPGLCRMLVVSSDRSGEDRSLFR